MSIRIQREFWAAFKLQAFLETLYSISTFLLKKIRTIILLPVILNLLNNNDLNMKSSVQQLSTSSGIKNGRTKKFFKK